MRPGKIVEFHSKNQGLESIGLKKLECGQFRPVPSGSVRFRPVPSGSVRFRPVPSGSVRFRPVPSGSVRFRPVPSGSVRFRPVPSGAVRFRPVPSGSVRFRPVPSGRHVTRRLSVVEADGAAAERPDGEDGMERKMVRVARANVGDHLLFCVVMTLLAGVYDAAPWCTIARTSSGGWGGSYRRLRQVLDERLQHTAMLDLMGLLSSVFWFGLS